MGSLQSEVSREERWSLKGMNALVTGGTRGIGCAIVEELAGFGAKVHTCARNKTALNEMVEEWNSKGFEVSASVCDLSSRTQREELIQTVDSVFEGKLHILINNAGISLLKKALEHTEEDFSRIMGINLESPYHLSQMAHPLLKASGRGSVVFISSVGGKIGLPGIAVYSASKAAINQLTKNLAGEWAKDDIRVNTVAPWAVNTAMTEEKMDEEIRRAYDPLLSRTPLRPIAEPNEISPLTAFLCLPVASYITGQVIYVDGGFTSCS